MGGRGGKGGGGGGAIGGGAATDTTDLTGANGLSTDPAIREVQIENRIRQAYAELDPGNGLGVEFSQLRARLGGDVSRAEVDATLSRLDPSLVLVYGRSPAQHLADLAPIRTYETRWNRPRGEAT